MRQQRQSRNFINPRDLKASELKAIVALHQLNRPAVMSNSCAFAGGLVVGWRTILGLIECGAAYVQNQQLVLTGAAHGLARSFGNRRIVGYD